MREFKKINLKLHFYYEVYFGDDVMKYIGLSYTHREPRIGNNEKTDYGASLSISTESELSKLIGGLQSYIKGGQDRKVFLTKANGKSVNIINIRLTELEMLLKDCAVDKDDTVYHAELDIH